MPKAFCGLETVRKIAPWTLCALWEKKLTSVREKPHHAPCKQPNRGISVITPLPFGGGVGGGATILWARNSTQKGSVRSVSSVREKPTQQAVYVLYHTVGAFYFSKIYTDEQNTQRPTETLSQPISQNVTATFSYNALWYLYAGGVLWVRNSAQICSVKSVSSVREKTPQHERKNT